MLEPQSNPYRQLLDLSGFWEFRLDPDYEGEAAGLPMGLRDSVPVAVPGSWNDQLAGARDHLGAAWYQTRFDLPWAWGGRRVRLRFGSVNYKADVFFNGLHLGSHEGGHLPFEFDVGPHLRGGGNLVVVRVDGELAPDRVPPGNVPSGARQRPYPDTTFDFFPYCGIHRPVLLYATAQDGIEDITVTTDVRHGEGLVRVRVTGAQDATVRVSLDGESTVARDGDAELSVLDAAQWSPEAPHLHELNVEVVRGGRAVDRYSLPIGIRTIRVDGDALLLNGKPVMLRGFGRHEDFAVAGRGYVPAVIVKDYGLLRWVGANSFRTSHYPYSEQAMALADRLGFMVIDETPAVGLYFDDEGLDRRLALCRQYTTELIARDKNHPSVVMWSLGNEPHAGHPNARAFFEDLFALARSLDSTRPFTVVSAHGAEDPSRDLSDVLCLNRYFGWYLQAGRLDDGCAALSRELDELHNLHKKPVILSEFGADAVAGVHSEPPEMFSEEYQAEMLSRYIGVLAEKPYVVGEHVWNLCDFGTGQSVLRVGGMNLKGVFTRDRRPKLAAHRLRELWGARAAEPPPQTTA